MIADKRRKSRQIFTVILRLDIMIQFENITKSFGTQTLFEHISFRINAKERIGLVGRNGHGKTTLFRMMVNDVQPDSGVILVPKNYRIGYVQQEMAFDKATVLEECMKGLPPNEQEAHWKAEKILMGLGFSIPDFDRGPFEFSGGYQVRLNLAKVLVSEPDLLLLDEPTNYLDITSIRWVADFLKNWPHEVMLITHDRGFMDKVVTHVVGIHRKKIKKIPGDTEKYYDQILAEEEVYEKTRLNEEKREKEIQLFINRFRAKARLANMVQSRIKTLAKKEKYNKLEKLNTLDFSFKSKPFPGKNAFSVQNISFGYNPDTPLIRNFSLTVKKGERICIIGKNGKGKTTLLKLFAKVLFPDTGKINYHPEITKGYFEQNQIGELVENRSVVDEIHYTHPDVEVQAARNICGAMMFSGDDALKKIQVLSGGEKSRVVLGKLLVTPANLLLLDEPTNHLDMESTDAMLAAIDNYNGTVIMVTHNEMFLHALAQRLIVFQDHQIRVFDGGYQDFLDKIGWQEENPSQNSQQSKAEKPKPSLQKKELKKIRSEFIANKSKVLSPIKKDIKNTEKQIEKKESELMDLTQAMQTASQEQNSTKIQELSKSIFNHQSGIDQLYDTLESLTEEYESRMAEFDEKLKEIENS